MSRMNPALMIYSTLLMFSEDSRIWTFSLTISVGLAALVAGILLRNRARRKSDTYKPPDTR